MSFNINNNIFVSSLDNLVKNSRKNEFKYLSQEFESKVFDLIKQKMFCPYEYISDLKNFNEQLPSKGNFFSSFTCNKLVIKSMSMFLRFGINLK